MTTVRLTLRRLGPDRGEQPLELPAGSVVRDALRAAGLHPETVLVARGAVPTIIPDDEPVHEGDVLLVTRVVTGGAASTSRAQQRLKSPSSLRLA